ncbi:hypothetical protein BDQ17DRAFT_1337794 [Cyathus striatus]|nr:hypothetical protein BDQ17DRAFT_1337794 [Cyathus striatus]
MPSPFYAVALYTVPLLQSPCTFPPVHCPPVCLWWWSVRGEGGGVGGVGGIVVQCGGGGIAVQGGGGRVVVRGSGGGCGGVYEVVVRYEVVEVVVVQSSGDEEVLGKVVVRGEARVGRRREGEMCALITCETRAQVKKVLVLITSRSLCTVEGRDETTGRRGGTGGMGRGVGDGAMWQRRREREEGEGHVVVVANHGRGEIAGERGDAGQCHSYAAWMSISIRTIGFATSTVRWGAYLFGSTSGGWACDNVACWLREGGGLGNKGVEETQRQRGNRGREET